MALHDQEIFGGVGQSDLLVTATCEMGVFKISNTGDNKNERTCLATVIQA